MPSTNQVTMNAVQVHEFIDDFNNQDSLRKNMTMETIPRPTPKKDQLLIKVLACSISPGDIHMVEGNLIFLHPEKMGFVPGMDVCGVVEDPNGCANFQKGDVVVAANGMSPQGGMAEYMAVDQSETVMKPKSVNVQVAAASSSAITARNAVLDNVRPGDRVLILGGSGGVGSTAIQLAKHHAKASFVATTSTQEEMCLSLGADRVIDYRKGNWWEMEEFQKAKFDVIIDTVGGGNFLNRASKVLKPRKQGGTFVAVVGDEPKPDARTVWKAIKFMTRMLSRGLYNSTFGRGDPKYVLIMPYNVPQGRQQVLNMLEDDTLQVKLDKRAPGLPFTEDGVHEAFQILASGHAHGKVVVSME